MTGTAGTADGAEGSDAANGAGSEPAEASPYDWVTGEGLAGIDDPGAADAAFERGAQHLGTAVIGLAHTCPPEVAAPRIVRAMRQLEGPERGYAFTAAGTVARLHGALTPQLYAALRAEGPGGNAEHALRDTLTFVPFKDLPWWFKRRSLLTGPRDRVVSWWLRAADVAGDAWGAVRRRH